MCGGWEGGDRGRGSLENVSQLTTMLLGLVKGVGRVLFKEHHMMWPLSQVLQQTLELLHRQWIWRIVWLCAETLSHRVTQAND